MKKRILFFSLMLLIVSAVMAQKAANMDPIEAIRHE